MLLLVSSGLSSIYDIVVSIFFLVIVIVHLDGRKKKANVWCVVLQPIILGMLVLLVIIWLCFPRLKSVKYDGDDDAVHDEDEEVVELESNQEATRGTTSVAV